MAIARNDKIYDCNSSPRLAYIIVLGTQTKFASPATMEPRLRSTENACPLEV